VALSVIDSVALTIPLFAATTISAISHLLSLTLQHVQDSKSCKRVRISTPSGSDVEQAKDNVDSDHPKTFNERFDVKNKSNEQV